MKQATTKGNGMQEQATQQTVYAEAVIGEVTITLVKEDHPYPFQVRHTGWGETHHESRWLDIAEALEAFRTDVDEQILQTIEDIA